MTKPLQDALTRASALSPSEAQMVLVCVESPDDLTRAIFVRTERLSAVARVRFVANIARAPRSGY